MGLLLGARKAGRRQQQRLPFRGAADVPGRRSHARPAAAHRPSPEAERGGIDGCGRSAAGGRVRGIDLGRPRRRGRRSHRHACEHLAILASSHGLVGTGGALERGAMAVGGHRPSGAGAHHRTMAPARRPQQPADFGGGGVLGGRRRGRQGAQEETRGRPALLHRMADPAGFHPVGDRRSPYAGRRHPLEQHFHLVLGLQRTDRHRPRLPPLALGAQRSAGKHRRNRHAWRSRLWRPLLLATAPREAEPS